MYRTGMFRQIFVPDGS